MRGLPTSLLLLLAVLLSGGIPSQGLQHHAATVGPHNPNDHRQDDHTHVHASGCTTDLYDQRSKEHYTLERLMKFKHAMQRFPTARVEERTLVIEGARLEEIFRHNLEALRLDGDPTGVLDGRLDEDGNRQYLMRIGDVNTGSGFSAVGSRQAAQFLADKYNTSSDIVHITCVENTAVWGQTIDPGVCDEFVVAPSCGWADSIPYQLDAIVICAGLHHQEDKQCFFDNAHRALRPGGHLSVSEVRKGSGAADWLNRVVTKYSTLPHDGMFPNPGEMSKMAQASSFDVKDESYKVYDWPFVNRTEALAAMQMTFRMNLSTDEDIAKEFETSKLQLVEYEDGSAAAKWGLQFLEATNRK